MVGDFFFTKLLSLHYDMARVKQSKEIPKHNQPFGSPDNDSSESEVDFYPETRLVPCISCEQTLPLTEVYRCQDCHPEETSEREDGTKLPPKFLCELCVVIHFRKNHELSDHKGYKPEFCPQHKYLCQMFCETCQIIVCFKCLGSHSKHDYKPISEKASIVRTQIFNHLNKFDALSKPLANRKANAEATCSSSHMEDYRSWSSEKIIDGLYDRCERIISENRDSWKKMVDDKLRNEIGIQGISQRANTQISQLRGMLSLSNGSCVMKFSDLDTKINNSIKEQEKVISDQQDVATWCNSLDSLLEGSISNAISAMTMEKIDHFPLGTAKVSSEAEEEQKRHGKRTTKGFSRLDRLNREGSKENGRTENQEEPFPIDGYYPTDCNLDLRVTENNVVFNVTAAGSFFASIS